MFAGLKSNSRLEYAALDWLFDSSYASYIFSRNNSQKNFLNSITATTCCIVFCCCAVLMSMSMISTAFNLLLYRYFSFCHFSFSFSTRSSTVQIKITNIYVQKWHNMWPKSCFYSHLTTLWCSCTRLFHCIQLPDTKHFHFSSVYAYLTVLPSVLFFLFSGCDVFVSVSSCLFLCLGHFLCAFLSFTTVFRFVLRKPYAYFWRCPRIQYIVHDSHRSHAQANFHTELYIIFSSCVVFFSYSSPVYSLINSFDTCIAQYAYHVI